MPLLELHEVVCEKFWWAKFNGWGSGARNFGGGHQKLTGWCVKKVGRVVPRKFGGWGGARKFGEGPWSLVGMPPKFSATPIVGCKPPKV